MGFSKACCLRASSRLPNKYAKFPNTPDVHLLHGIGFSLWKASLSVRLSKSSMSITEFVRELYFDGTAPPA